MLKKLLFVSIFLFLFGCLSDPANEQLNQVTNIPNIYSIEDFKNLGLKIGEKYDSNDLPSALSVYWGFWKDVDADEGSARFQSLGGSVGGMRDFEIRFYASHADAVKYGTKFAINATGPDAVLTKKALATPVLRPATIPNKTRGTDPIVVKFAKPINQVIGQLKRA